MISEPNALGRALHGLVQRFKRLIYQSPFRTHRDRLILP
jgi:hypothetical protein